MTKSLLQVNEMVEVFEEPETCSLAFTGNGFCQWFVERGLRRMEVEEEHINGSPFFGCGIGRVAMVMWTQTDIDERLTPENARWVVRAMMAANPHNNLRLFCGIKLQDDESK